MSIPFPHPHAAEAPSHLATQRGLSTSVARARTGELLPYVLLMAVFVFFGLTGHDPWKADEAYVFGVIHSMLDSGNWIVPTVAGEPFMEKPPLYYWVAGIMVRLLGGWMDAPDAARMASGVFMAITCWAIGSAAHQWWGKGAGRYAPLLLLACLGVLTQTHMMMPDVPLLSGFALSAWGFSWVLSRPVAGGLLLGVGAGIGFLSKGILGPAVLGLTALMLPVCFSEWRTANFLRGLMIALAVSLPFILIWPLALYARSPALFSTWFWDNNFGRFFGFSPVHNGTEHVKGFWLQTLPWFTFPALPLAMLAMWRNRLLLLNHPAMQYGVIATVVMSLVLATSESVRAIYALPLLVPLAILATPSAFVIHRLPDLIWARTSQLMFVGTAGLIWLGWLIMMGTDAVPQWAWLLRVMPADFVPEFDAPTFSLALTVTIAACYALRLFAALPARGLTSWLTGLTLTWALLSTLWMPWLDYGKSYRKVFSEIAWTNDMTCIASIGLGESERAMLDYITNRTTIRREIQPVATCNTLLMQGYATTGNGVVDQADWEQVWEGARPGDDWQRFWLFRTRHPTTVNATPDLLAQQAAAVP